VALERPEVGLEGADAAIELGVAQELREVFTQEGVVEAPEVSLAAQPSDHTGLPWTLSTVRSRTLQRKEGYVVLLLPALTREGVELFKEEAP
jgi:hypothetical protein